MLKFAERLKEYMQECGYNQTSLANATGIKNTNISDFLLGNHLPSYENFVKLLYVFQCSADYLLGLTEIHVEEVLHPVLPFGMRLLSLLNARGVSQERLKRELPVSGSVLYKWVHEKSAPSVESLLRLAEYFECSVDYLIGRIQ
ncbi:MAG: helix-turn-helix domain-containing protein [Clostridia bacterium]|nr:helix-turn-helix domain-containing protein [Clostridia bacterium]